MTSEIHNKLVEQFVKQVASETKSQAEMMVVIESTIFAAMLIMSRVHNATPAVSSSLVEEAVHRAIERFSKGNLGK